MAHNDFYKDDEVINFQQKCPAVFVVDVSGSMSGAPINELNKGLKIFQDEIIKDDTASARLDVAVISFNSTEKVEHDFELMGQYQMPTLAAGGGTNMEAGLKKGLELLDARKNWYRETHQTYYRPYIILISDGYAHITESLKKQIHEAAKNKKLNFWPIGVNGADMSMLEKIACPGEGASLPPNKLDGLKFVELFQWLSASFTKVSNSTDGENVDLTPEEGKNPFKN